MSALKKSHSKEKEEPGRRRGAREGAVDAAEHAVAAGTPTLVVGPFLNPRSRAGAAKPGGAPSSRPAASRLEEAVGLASAIDLDVVEASAVNLSEIRPSTYLGKGRVEEFAALVKEREIALVVMDCALSPVQQRNLEKAFAAKVIDRTGLILEIFGRRARTREGALQVELAHLEYQKSRLVRSWTHLERQRGGFGFLGGPGETQIETDRRLISERIGRIERDLEAVKRTRALHRKTRRDAPWPVVALVGYTNAGKSTLFNRLTKAEVLAKDMLFATLDPTLRAVELPHGGKAILSDTVGFISELPTMLVSAFRATLEEVTGADVILHVRDIAHEDSLAQSEDVAAILAELGVDPADRRRVVEVWNKIDMLDDGRREQILNAAGRAEADSHPFPVSALTGEGLDELLASIEERIAGDRPVVELAIEPGDGAGLHWLYEQAEVLRRRDDEDGRAHLTVRVAPERLGALKRRFGPPP